MQIKNAKIEDIGEIVVLAKNVFGKFCWTKNQFIDEINNNFSHFLLIVEHKKIIGYIIFQKLDNNIDLLDIAVEKTFQNKGYGKKLMQKMFAYAYLNNIEKIMLEVDYQNTNAISFYEKFGFIEIARRKRYYQNGNDAIILQKLIREKVEKVRNFLNELFEEPKCELNFESNFQLLVAVILSAQCTDKRVNDITKEMYKRYKTPEDFVKLGQVGLEKEIYSCGFYHNKAKNIISACKDLINKYNSEVPNNYEDLLSLAGVGQKTANVVFSTAFKKPAIAVDTHVSRVSQRLGLSYEKQPNIIEENLCDIFEKSEWSKIHHQMVLFGRYFCKSRNPNCKDCKLFGVCEYKEKNI